MTEAHGLGRKSLANLVRGASAGLLAIALPPVLVRALPPDAFSAWALVLQLTSYIALLDLGLQVGIARFVARENHLGRERYFFGGMFLLVVCGVAAVLASFALALLLPVLFPRIAPHLIGNCREAVLLIGCSTAVSLPGSAIVSLFIGLENYALPAIVVATGRLLQCGSVALVAVLTHDLVPIAACFAAWNLAIQAAYWFCLKRFGPSMQFHRSKVVRPVMAELARYCASLSVWTLSMLLVSGLDVAIVAELDFKSVAAYSVCANLIAVLVGFVGASFNVLIPRASALDGKDDREGVGRLLLQSTQLCALTFLGIALVAVLLARPLMSVWVGPTLAATGTPILFILIGANTVRLLMTPYATILMGTGEQKWATGTALTEGVVNLVLSIVLGRQLGAIGVALGTLVGAVVGVALAIGYTLPRATRIACGASRFLIDGLLTSVACYLPLLVVCCLFLAAPSPMTGLALAVGAAATIALLLRFGPPMVRQLAFRLVSRAAA